MSLDTAPPDIAAPADTSGDGHFLGWTAVIVAFAALVVGFVALGNFTDDESSATGASGAPTTTLEVELGALRLLPDHLMAEPGRVVLQVTNTDSAVHNLTVAGAHLADLQPGASAELDLGVLEEGSYEMLCEISGHADAGMKGTLMIAASGTEMGGSAEATGAAAPDDHFHGYASAEEMQAAMDARAMRFVEEQKGTFGGRPMEHTLTDDGYKQFDVTAEIVDWEVEPGKVVQAYTYNGTVPAPEIHVEVGDKVRVVLHNELPVGTVIHWHGIRVPNSMDGVPPFTQPAVMPGETFTYEFEALEPAVGIYHSHNGASQVLDGLFGAFTIGEMVVPQALLDQGFAAEPSQTINMVLNDAGVIGLSLNGKSFPATEAYTGKVGDTVMVNYYNEGLMAHPMHLHQPLGWIIAKDGKELLEPMPGDTINIAPGERYTVIYKLTDPGVWAWHCHILTHAEGQDGMFGMVTAFIVEE
jgi:FtsP/CotA-like multicopper oxidase with cupredoxin domain